MPDHIHMLVSIPPKISVSSFMGYLKGKSALMIFDKHANLKYKFGNRHFWAEGYYVSTVGLNEATIKKYIQEQEKHDIAMDKLSVKEYEDPFKGYRSFIDCETLEDIEFPKSLEKIGMSAFAGSKWLEKQPEGPVYVNDILLTWKGQTETAIIDEGTTYIEEAAFDN